VFNCRRIIGAYLILTLITFADPLSNGYRENLNVTVVNYRFVVIREDDDRRCTRGKTGERGKFPAIETAVDNIGDVNDNNIRRFGPLFEKKVPIAKTGFG